MLKIHNLLRLSILLLLYQKPSYGYELIKKLSPTMGQRVSASHIYPFLHELQKRGWLSLKQIGKREKHVFNLAPKGKKEVEKLLAQFGMLVEASLSPRISTCAHCGCKVFKGGFLASGRIFCCKFCARAWK